jgi:hypothetical protein
VCPLRTAQTRKGTKSTLKIGPTRKEYLKQRFDAYSDETPHLSFHTMQSTIMDNTAMPFSQKHFLM